MIRVSQLTATYWMDSHHPSPQHVRARLDGLVSRQLAIAVASALPAAHHSDPSVWFLRTLHTGAVVDLDLDDSTIVSQWAATIASSVDTALQPDNPEAIHFPTRAHYLAAYLNAAATTGADRWYFREFNGLTLLSGSAKIRTVIQHWPDACPALALFDDPTRTALAARLTPADAAHILQWLSDPNSADRAVDLTAAHALWLGLGRPQPLPDTAERWALHLALDAAARLGLPAASRLAALTPALAHVLTLTPDPYLARALAQADWRTIAERHGASSAAQLQPLQHLDLNPWLAPAPQSADDPITSQTPHGGAFLLLPLLASVQGISDLPHAAWFRLWVLARALGATQARAVWSDRLLRELCGASPQADQAEFTSWLADESARAPIESAVQLATKELYRDGMPPLTEAAAPYFDLPESGSAPDGADELVRIIAFLILRAFAWRVPGFALSSPDHLNANFLRFSAKVSLEPSRLLVRLCQPPLGILLNLNGMNRQQYTLPWLAQPHIELFPEA
jgi:hypothetical protein